MAQPSSPKPSSPKPSSPKDDSLRGLHVRTATVADAATIGDLYLRSWRASYLGLVPPEDLEPVALERARYDWQSALVDAHSWFGLGLVGAEPAGLVKLGPDPTEAIRGTWLELCYVVPEYWGSGIAVSLLNQAVIEAADRGAAAVRLRVVEVQDRARRFYEREGWSYDPDVPTSRNNWFPLLCMRRETT